jgi:Flp pilus assembly protein TadG
MPTPTVNRCGRWRERLAARDERGSVAFIVVMWSVVVLALAGLVIDGSLMISQKERAADLAAQAARAQAENLNLVELRRTGLTEIQLGPAADPCKIAQNYLKQNTIHNGLASIDVNAAGTNGVTVCVSVTYQTLFINLSPVATACATAHAAGHV